MRPDLLIDQLAELASQRNQDALDACFLDLFEDLLGPTSLAVLRVASDDRVPHWRIQRRGTTGDDAGSAGQAPRPPLSALPLHLDAWHSGQIRHSEGGPAVTVIPMGGRDATDCLVELRMAQPLGPVEQRLLTGVQRFHQHLRSLVDEN